MKLPKQLDLMYMVTSTANLKKNRKCCESVSSLAREHAPVEQGPPFASLRYEVTKNPRPMKILGGSHDVNRPRPSLADGGPMW